MNRMKRATALLLTLLLAVSLCACGSAGKSSYTPVPTPAPAYVSENAAYAVMDAPMADEEAVYADGDYGFSAMETAAAGNASAIASLLENAIATLGDANPSAAALLSQALDQVNAGGDGASISALLSGAAALLG